MYALVFWTTKKSVSVIDAAEVPEGTKINEIARLPFQNRKYLGKVLKFHGKIYFRKLLRHQNYMPKKCHCDLNFIRISFKRSILADDSEYLESIQVDRSGAVIAEIKKNKKKSAR